MLFKLVRSNDMVELLPLCGHEPRHGSQRMGTTQQPVLLSRLEGLKLALLYRIRIPVETKATK